MYRKRVIDTQKHSKTSPRCHLERNEVESKDLARIQIMTSNSRGAVRTAFTSEPMDTSVLNDKRTPAKFEFSIRYVAIGVRTPREKGILYRPAYTCP